MRKFGVEIECYVTSIKLLEELLQNNNVEYSYVHTKEKHVVYPHIKLIKDSSIKKMTNYESIEINTPPSVDFKYLQQVCDVLKQIDSLCCNNCALHIHIDLTDKQWDDGYQIMSYYWDHENDILQQIWDIQHKKPILTQSLRFMRNKFSSTHHLHLNLYEPFKVYKTIEHRAFMGTIDYDEIIQCILLTQDIVEKGLQYKKGRN